MTIPVSTPRLSEWVKRLFQVRGSIPLELEPTSQLTVDLVNAGDREHRLWREEHSWLASGKTVAFAATFPSIDIGNPVNSGRIVTVERVVARVAGLVANTEFTIGLSLNPDITGSATPAANRVFQALDTRRVWASPPVSLFDETSGAAVAAPFAADAAAPSQTATWASWDSGPGQDLAVLAPKTGLVVSSQNQVNLVMQVSFLFRVRPADPTEIGA